MNVCIFYYDGFAEFEIAVAALILRNENIFSAALESREYVCEEMQRMVPDKRIDELNPDEIDLFIIPGGNPVSLYENEKLKAFIQELNQRGKEIAGICGGAELLAAYGILDHKRCTGDGEGFKVTEENKKYYKNAIILNEGVVEDGNIITSMGKAFIDFAVCLGVRQGVIKPEEASVETKWLKNL